MYSSRFAPKAMVPAVIWLREMADTKRPRLRKAMPMSTTVSTPKASTAGSISRNRATTSRCAATMIIITSSIPSAARYLPNTISRSRSG